MRMLLAAVLVLSAQGALAGPEDLRDGEVRKNNNGVQQAWDAEQQQWLSMDGFWKAYADRKGGYTWGDSAVYPPYEQVNEFDTLLIQVDSGPCLMEFFHSRWRRANDVRRWDESFNEYGGCARVFD
mgnify:CR=1 FL=1